MEILGVAWEIWFIYLVLFGVFVSFIVEKVSADITAMAGMVILIAVGIINREEALSVFSNPAPITIAAMFILSAALERTGCIQILGNAVGKWGGRSELMLMLVFMPIAFFISAFMNNTPVVIVLTPVLISLARKFKYSSSKLLIPLSYAAIMGGTCTLIGTSTNLLVNGIVVDSGMPSFNMFEITLPGLMMAAAGFLYLLTIGRFLLPNRSSLSTILGGRESKKYIVQLVVQNDSKLIDKKLSESSLLSGEDSVIIDVMRSGDSMRDYLNDLKIKANDRILLETNTSEILGIKESGLGQLTSSYSSESEKEDESTIIVVEGIVAETSLLKGKLINGLNLKRQYGASLLGHHRPHHNAFLKDISDRSILRSGDSILLEGPAESIQKLFEDTRLINLTIPEDRPIRRQKAPIALLTMIAVVALSAFEIMPIALLAMIGVGVVVLTRCIDYQDIYKTIDWSILFLIFGMLGISQGMETTGAAALIVDNIVSVTEAYGPLILLAAIYLLTSFLTEIISNNAVAALLTPIAIGVATSLGLDPKPFLVAIMFGASASFATPIGYQTNTFVYAAGGYKFRDFLLIGVPMNIIMFIVAVFVIPLFWPLEG